MATRDTPPSRRIERRSASSTGRFAGTAAWPGRPSRSAIYSVRQPMCSGQVAAAPGRAALTQSAGFCAWKSRGTVARVAYAAALCRQELIESMTSHSEPGQLQAIAGVVSPYGEKFGVPRQPGLVAAAKGYIEMLPGFDRIEAFEGIEGFSHLWAIFGFHACGGQQRLRVRPPRLGGNEERGVFATRSPFRPNNLGLSVLRFEGLEQTENHLRVAVSGLDMVDGTPVYDIKPYVPYTDSIPQAQGALPPAHRSTGWRSFSAPRQTDSCLPCRRRRTCVSWSSRLWRSTRGPPIDGTTASVCTGRSWPVTMCDGGSAVAGPRSRRSHRLVSVENTQPQRTRRTQSALPARLADNLVDHLRVLCALRG